MYYDYRFNSRAIRRFAMGIYGLAFSLLIWHSEAQANVVFDPASGSYFEFVGKRSLWELAAQAAAQRRYKGRSGRLAVIRNRETHEFLQQNLRKSQRWVIVWIGLRYYCGNRKLTWVTGETLKTGSGFQPWHRKWHRTYIKCGPRSRFAMPVYYDGGFWQAAGSGKGGTGYIVEYPAQR